MSAKIKKEVISYLETEMEQCLCETFPTKTTKPTHTEVINQYRKHYGWNKAPAGDQLIVFKIGSAQFKIERTPFHIAITIKGMKGAKPSSFESFEVLP